MLIESPCILCMAWPTFIGLMRCAPMQISIKKDINYCTYYIEITAGRSGETAVILKQVYKKW